MTQESVAGHFFDELGRCTRLQSDGTACPILWRSIACADQSDVNSKGLAHYGILTPDELAQIRKKRQAELEAIDRAMASLKG